MMYIAWVDKSRNKKARKWRKSGHVQPLKHQPSITRMLVSALFFLSSMSLLNVLFISFTIAKIFDLLIAEIEKANNPPSEEKNGCVIS